MAQFGVGHVQRSCKYGVEAKGLTGNNYISLFYGDGQAQPTNDVSNGDIECLNREIRKHIPGR